MFKWPLLSPLCHALPPLSAVGVVVRGVGPLAAERPVALAATVRTKAPTSTCATPYTTTCRRIHTPPPPAGSREAAAARCPDASTSVWRAQGERVALLQRTAARSGDGRPTKPPLSLGRDCSITTSPPPPRQCSTLPQRLWKFHIPR